VLVVQLRQGQNMGQTHSLNHSSLTPFYLKDWNKQAGQESSMEVALSKGQPRRP